MSSTFDCVDKRKRLEFAPGLPSPGSRLIPELAQDFFIRASQGASPINATEEDSSMPLADPGSTTPGMEGALMAFASDALQAEASGGGDGSSTVDTISAESTPPSTQVTQPEAPLHVFHEAEFSPTKKKRFDGGPLVLQVAEQLSASDAQHMIVDAFNRRAFELSLGVDLSGETELKAPPRSGRGEPDVDMTDAFAVDGCPPTLAVAEQISAEDAQCMIVESFNERASQLEREEIDAKASYMAALASRGGN